MSEVETKERTTAMMVRVSVSMHAAAKEKAHDEGKSLNQFCVDAIVAAIGKSAIGATNHKRVACPECSGVGSIEFYRGEPSQGYETQTCQVCRGEKFIELPKPAADCLDQAKQIVQFARGCNFGRHSEDEQIQMLAGFLDKQPTPAVPEIPDADCEIVAVGDYGDSVIFMGSQKFRIEHAALVKLPSAVDARAFGKRLLRLVGVRFIEK